MFVLKEKLTFGIMLSINVNHIFKNKGLLIFKKIENLLKN